MSISDVLTRVATHYQNLNAANVLTISRVIAVPFFIVALAYNHNGIALVIFVICGLTDGLDGFIARTYHQRTKIGAFLDPLADKLLLTSSFITLALVELPNTIPFWLIVTVISRDLIISIGIAVLFMLETNVTISPTKIGKLTTFLQLSLIILILFFNVSGLRRPDIIHLVCWITFVVTVSSGLGYVYKGIRLLNTTSTDLDKADNDSQTAEHES
ncbi:CDP-diacylglycerol--glycerol-3-phosphate 3-phosphatidyltransferase [candidate division KSB3 bacterium]|uniref:CDP-diacylglycerol--glycerol-3-phosphate 3-phosphatidyltransferase n=1 Tax=candidate division KSB3 bacterium TaxID=2044937 RepID=A0A2G6E9T0_9BACT|nr:MAG: CDP-diacylglycerol--glycerol-3-phosphate 3-phosphatidyltransferase [candidate division KSB3 bacterium]PIE30897.1 MAG: CDP-diacylglycerol--glycerol-3-phosphate 3-phosphatidyltransferase [candidate division KSB3 bacterium]